MNRWVQIAFLHTCQHLSLVFFMVTMLTGELFISVVLICISLISAVDHCSMSLLAKGEGDGSPLQYSCLENPMDGGAW